MYEIASVLVLSSNSDTTISFEKFTYSFTNPRASNTPLVHGTKNDLVKKLRRLASVHGEIIEFFGGTRHLSTILLKKLPLI